VSRRAVLRLTDYSGTIKDAAEFFDYLKELGCGPRTRFQYQVDEEGNPRLVVELPEGAVHALERKQAPPVRTKTQQAIYDRVEARKAAVKAGEAVPGHEKPVKGLKRRKK
jgi:hypothetical protein